MKFIISAPSTERRSSSSNGELVGYEDGSEATWAFDGETVPTDATIVAIIDKVNINE